MASRDLIITSLHRVNFKYAAPFLLSLKRANYRGDIVIFTSRMKTDDLAGLRAYGVKVVPFRFWGSSVRQRLAKFWPVWRLIFQSHISQKLKEHLAHVVFHLFYRRHLLYLDFLRQHGRDYDRVFLTDCRDVYFQADPFSWDLPPGIHVFLEDDSNRLGKEPSHDIAIKNQFGAAALAKISGQTISCAGTVLGDTASIMAYLAEMVSTTMQARSLRDVCADQAIHNYVIYNHQLGNATLHHNQQGPVMTVGAMQRTDIRLNNEGLVIQDSGRIIPVLHQHDRHPDVEKILLSHLPATP